MKERSRDGVIINEPCCLQVLSSATSLAVCASELQISSKQYRNHFTMKAEWVNNVLLPSELRHTVCMRVCVCVCGFRPLKTK